MVNIRIFSSVMTWGVYTEWLWGAIQGGHWVTYTQKIPIGYYSYTAELR